MLTTDKAKGLLLPIVALFLLAAFGRASAVDTTYVRFNTTLGSIDVQLLSDEAPNTVANFLTYVNSGAYYNSFIHRSLSVATSGLGIFQGGSYDLMNGQIEAIPANAPVANEFNVSNTSGTLAMALVGSDPNSATNGWFFNAVDNSASLDPQSFTVFGTVANSSSLAVMNALAAVNVPNPGPLASPFNQIPLINYVSGQQVTTQNLVYVNSIVLESAPVAATVTLSDLTPTFTDAAQGVTVTTNPPGLAAIVTYNGSPNAPSAIGTYTVNASITSPGYAGNATGTFVIGNGITKTKATVTLDIVNAKYDGNPHPATATTTPPGLDVTFTYNDASTLPTTGGSYTVLATINDPTYEGSATGTLVISKATTTVTLGNLAATYNGTPQSPTATTSPPGLDVTYTYNGSATTPTTAGSYTVVGTINDPNYQGGATGTFVIGKSTAATITLTPASLTATYSGTAQPVTATTSPSGLTVDFTYNGKTTVPTAAGTYTVVGTISNADYAGSATGSLVINPATATVTLTPASLAAVYNGKAHAAAATTSPTGLSVTFTYNSSATAPILVNSYTVVGTVSNVDYVGSATGTLTISAIPPLAVTSTAAAITDSSATLSGTSNPEGSATTVSFQYGLTTSYTNTTTGQSAGSGTASVPFSTGIRGLAPQKIYHYRAVASHGGAPVYGADKTFTTLAAPVFVGNPAAYLAATGAEVGLSVNPGGVATTIYFEYSTSSNFSTFSTTAVQSIGSGKVLVNLYALFPNLLAGQLYYYQAVISSAAVGTNFPGPSGSFTTLPFDTALVAQKGGGAPDVSGGTFASFGNPAVNTQDGVAFAGTLTTGAGGVTTGNDLGVWADDNTGTLTLIAQSGSGAAPGTTANFLTFSDPVYNDHEALAFRGTLKVATGQATSTTATGVWATTGSPDSLALVARQGGAAPGANGGTFDAFTSLGLTDADDAVAVLYATLNTSTAAGVTTANNAGIWEGSAPGNLALLLRLGQTVGSKTITKLAFLPVETTVNGQTRGFNSNSGDIVCGATFSDKSTGIVTVIGGTASLAEVSGSTATGGATFASFGNPTINTSDDLAFEATLTTGAGGVTTGNDLGLWTDTAGTLALIAQSGGAAPGTTPPANFLTFSDPVYNNNEAVAFRATLKVATGQATSTTATGIWATNGSPGSLALVAQQGLTQAPGCPGGATFSGFTELALADQGGVMMLATLNTSSTAGVTTANNLGIWAVDTTGALRLIARTGDTLNGKTVTALAFLPAETTVNGQGRSFAQANGDLVYLATFSDKSTAIFNVVFP